MNLVLNVNIEKNLEKGDILVFNGECWVNLSKDEYLAKLMHTVELLEKKCDDLEITMKELKDKVSELRGEDDEKV